MKFYFVTVVAHNVGDEFCRDYILFGTERSDIDLLLGCQEILAVSELDQERPRRDLGSPAIFAKSQVRRREKKEEKK